MLCLVAFDIALFYGSGNIQVVSQVSDIPGISFRLGTTQLVVEVSHV